MISGIAVWTFVFEEIRFYRRIAAREEAKDVLEWQTCCSSMDSSARAAVYTKRWVRGAGWAECTRLTRRPAEGIAKDKLAAAKFHAPLLFDSKEEFEKSTFGGLVEKLSAFVASGGVDPSKTLLVAEAFGVELALGLKAAHPDQAPKAMLLLSPAFNAAFSKVFTDVVDGWESTGKATFTTSQFGPAEIGFNFYKSVLDSTAEDTAPADHTTIIHGLKDDVTPIENPREYCKRYSKAKLIEVDDNGALEASAAAIAEAAVALAAQL